METNVLIVDDSVFARSIVRKSLEIYGFKNLNIYEAYNGYEALAILNIHHIDVVFTDLNMPDFDGEELLNKIKSNPKLTGIPVIVITSLLNPAREQRLLEGKASAILQKPVTLPKIKDILTEKLQFTGVR